MALMTPQAFEESLKSRKPRVFISRSTVRYAPPNYFCGSCNIKYLQVVLFFVLW